METITVNGIEYVRKSDVRDKALAVDGLEYCMVRTQNAGVFAGYIEKREGSEVKLRNARRIWYWEGAATLSQLAMQGTSKPEACKFPCEVMEVTLLGVIEIIPCTTQAKESIEGVEVWEE